VSEITYSEFIVCNLDHHHIYTRKNLTIIYKSFLTLGDIIINTTNFKKTFWRNGIFLTKEEIVQIFEEVKANSG